MAEDTQQFGSISLGSRSGALSGVLRVTPNGFTWKKTVGTGGKTVEVPSKDLERIIWTKVSRGCQLGLKRKDGSTVNFTGFRDKDLEHLGEAAKGYGKVIEEMQMSTLGRNWGNAVLDGSTLVFQVDGKPAFRFPLRDVGQVQKGRDDVMLEFPNDDTGGDNEDALFEMSFYVPKDNPGFAVTEEEGGKDALANFHDQVIQHTDAGAATGNAIATFESVHILAPRGRFEVEMYMSSLKLTGQAQDYRIQYDSITRMFVLPKTNTPQTLVVISLDPPIRKGQTYYPHILCQFSNDEDIHVDMDLTEEQLAAKNEKCGGKLESHISGTAFDVFAKALRGLSASKLTKPGNFRTNDGLGHAVRCSYKSDDGYLYPLERAFFYVQKPPTLLVHDEIESIEFLRQGGIGVGTGKTFDLAIRLRQDQEFLFRGIDKVEWTNLFSFIQAKRLRIENVDEAKQGPAGPGRPTALQLELGDDVDAGMANLQAKGEMDSEEDEDFAMGSADEADEGEPSSESEAEGEGSQPGLSQPRPIKAQTADGSSRPVKKAKTMAPAADSGKVKKPRAKKDKNAPKAAMSAFMFFSQEMREKVKQDNPGSSFGDIGKRLGEAWKATPPDQRTKWEELARKDKQRAADAMAQYKEQKAATELSGNNAMQTD